MKQKIAWHEECLKNNEKSLEDEIKKRDNLTRRIWEIEKRVTFMTYQVSEAKRTGIDSYDQDKFRHKKKLQLYESEKEMM